MGTVMFAMTPRTDTATKTRGRINYSSPAPREQPSLLPIITRGRRRGVRRGCSKRSHFFFPSQTILMENYRVFFFISSRRTETKCGEALSWGFMWLYISKDAAGNLSTNLTQKKKPVTTDNLLFSIVCPEPDILCWYMNVPHWCTVKQAPLCPWMWALEFILSPSHVAHTVCLPWILPTALQNVY